MLHDVFGILATLAAFALLVGGLMLYRRTALSSPELLRKLLHVGMGAVVLAFPWVFRNDWPVVLMTGLFVTLLVARRRRPKSRQPAAGGPLGGLAGVLDGVGRQSLGDVYFAVSVGVLFVASRHGPVAGPMLYVIPILLLALPDATAALVGGRYGRHRYHATAGDKSCEGSVAFFAVALLAVHVPLLLWVPAVGRVECLLIAATLALLAMILEAIAWRGLDNLFVPLGSFVLLKAFIPMPAAALAECAAVAAACLVFALGWRRRTTLDGGAALGAALALYVAWALGGWRWLLAPLATFVGYAVLWPRTARERAALGHNIQAVASVAAAGLAWVFIKQAADWGGRLDVFYPYTLGFAAHVAIIGATRMRRSRPGRPTWAVLALTTAQAWALLFVPYLLVEGFLARQVALSLLALPVVATAAGVFYAIQPGIADCPVDLRRWVRQGGCAVAASGVASGVGVLALRWT